MWTNPNTFLRVQLQSPSPKLLLCFSEYSTGLWLLLGSANIMCLLIGVKPPESKWDEGSLLHSYWACSLLGATSSPKGSLESVIPAHPSPHTCRMSHKEEITASIDHTVSRKKNSTMRSDIFYFCWASIIKKQWPICFVNYLCLKTGLAPPYLET